MSSTLQAWALPGALLAVVNIAATWLNLVESQVLEPYLDEFFHVPQAEKFCKGNYSWDPKITTPPGLYLITKLLEPMIGCELWSMRVLSMGALCAICPLSYGILRLLRTPLAAAKPESTMDKDRKGELIEEGDPNILLDAHTALNISLFPPLFFFSALYYTDVVSTLFVLLSYSALVKKRNVVPNTFESFNAIYVGGMSLLMRQTNVFWVAVLPAGLAITKALSRPKASTEFGARNVAAVLQNSWNDGVVYDCSVQNAGLQDYVLFLISLPTAMLKKLPLVLKVASPYVTILLAFVGFVVWNGGVVLGDKLAHTATLHLPQMLYLWPYMIFFSAPLVLLTMLHPILAPSTMKYKTSASKGVKTATKIAFPPLLGGLIFVSGGLAIVHLNTIIHPYTLADNRHYVFYVFKIIRRYEAIKYLAVPIYFICAWLVLESYRAPIVQDGDKKLGSAMVSTKTTIFTEPCNVSFVAIWLITTTLSVITAPLVEPRYFILPWIFWRMHMAYTPTSVHRKQTAGQGAFDMRLVLETIWLVIINIAVGYVFLFKDFAWPSEPGKIQRFLW